MCGRQHTFVNNSKRLIDVYNRLNIPVSKQLNRGVLGYFGGTNLQKTKQTNDNVLKLHV